MNKEAGAGKTQLEMQRHMMDALEAQLAEKEAALAHITSTATGNISESLSPHTAAVEWLCMQQWPVADWPLVLCC